MRMAYAHDIATQALLQNVFRLACFSNRKDSSDWGGHRGGDRRITGDAGVGAAIGGAGGGPLLRWARERCGRTSRIQCFSSLWNSASGKRDTSPLDGNDTLSCQVATIKYAVLGISGL